ncbi:phage tail terminator family protein [Tepidibacter mesophilus]|uniref:phage tail terminator family protein n=1 Tax=Tepidibacter mesophilus TaxID=655607 RepID=UPI000C06FA28|nr:hypothetical protein [Tepidibacter mesophilus]
MIKNSDIYKCVVQRLEIKYANTKITTPDKKEGLIRPSFLLKLDTDNSSDFMNDAKDKNMTVRIYYFSKDRNENYLENMDIQDELEELFLNQKLYLNDGSVLNILRLEFDTVDKVLHCSFELMLTDKYEKVDNTPIVENLDLQLEVEVKEVGFMGDLDLI